MIDFAKTLEAHTVIEASAGTGKTFTIQEIIKVAIAQNVPIEKIAVITFTEKAAAELQQRIRSEIVKMNNPENGDNQLFELARQNFCNATIGTIHHFCRQILREYSHQAGLSPEFEEIKDERIEFDKVFSRFKGELDLLQSEGITDLIKLTGFSLFKDFLYKSASIFQKKFPMVEPPDIQTLAGKISTLFEFRKIMNITKPPDYILKMQEALSFDSLDDMAMNYGIFYEAFFTQKEEVRSNPRKFIVKNFSITEKEYDGLLGYLKIHLLYYKFYPQIKTLCEKSREFNSRVTGYFQENDRTTTSAIILQTRDLICGHPDILLKIRSKFRYIIIDEFQDTSPVQADLFWTILGETGKGLIFVGDPKQSIYRFLNSDIQSYEATVRKIKQKMTLGETRRSTNMLTDAFNLIFPKFLGIYSMVFSAREDSFCYDQELSPLVLLGLDAKNLPRNSSSDNMEYNANSIRQDASVEIAGLIRYLIDKKISVFDTKTKTRREILYSDIAILARGKTNFHYLENEFSKNAIPSSIYKNAKFYENSFIRAISFLLHAIENPNDSVSLFKALKSDLFLIPDEILFSLSENEEISYLSGSSFSDINRIFSILERLHSGRNFQTVSETILNALNEFEIMRKFSLGFYGNRNVTDLYHLCEIVNKYQIEEGLSYGEVVRRLKSDINLNTEQAVKINSDKNSGESAVSVMTIHASKGLEFPVVILYDLSAEIDYKEDTCGIYPQDSAFYSDGIVSEISIKLADNAGYLCTPAVEEKIIREKKESMDEETRLLYVALTRARDYLVLPLHQIENQKAMSQRKILDPAFEPSCIEEMMRNRLAVNFQPSAFGIAIDKSEKRNESGVSEISTEKYIFAFHNEMERMERLEIESYTSISKKHKKKLLDENPENGIALSHDENKPKGGVYFQHQENVGMKFGSLCHGVLENFPLDSLQSDNLIKEELTDLVNSMYSKSGIIEEENYSRADLFRICLAALTKPHLISSNPRVSARVTDWKHFQRERQFYHYMGDTANSNEKYFYGIGDGMFFHDTKYYILDWKTNLLDDYSEESLRAIVDDAYYYQCNIYCLNFLNNLSWFAGQDKKRHWEEKFGGMLFVFLRETNDNRGICSIKPSYEELIQFQQKYMNGTL